MIALLESVGYPSVDISCCGLLGVNEKGLVVYIRMTRYRLMEESVIAHSAHDESGIAHYAREEEYSSLRSDSRLLLKETRACCAREGGE